MGKQGRDQTTKGEKRRNVPVQTKILGIGAAVVVVIAIVGFIALTAKPTALLFGLDKGERDAAAYLAGDRATVVTADGAFRAGGRENGAALVVARLGKSLALDPQRYHELPDALLMRTVPSLRNAALVAGKRLAMPLFVDHFELMWNVERVKKLGLPEIRTMAELEHALAGLKKNGFPLAFAGKDDETLLLVASAFILSEGGVPAYRAAVDAIASGSPLKDLLGTALRTSPRGDVVTFASALGRLARWMKEGWVHPEWHALGHDDIRKLVEGGQIDLTLQLLSFHRGIAYQAVSRYDSGRFPAALAEAESGIVAPVTVAAAKRDDRKALAALESMADKDKGAEASRLSGRSSAIAAAQAADVQTADALQFVAASNVVVCGLYRDAFADEKAAKTFADELRAWLRTAK